MRDQEARCRSPIDIMPMAVFCGPNQQSPKPKPARGPQSLQRGHAEVYAIQASTALHPYSRILKADSMFVLTVHRQDKNRNRAYHHVQGLCTLFLSLYQLCTAVQPLNKCSLVRPYSGTEVPVLAVSGTSNAHFSHL